MARNPITPLRLDEATKTRWQAEADRVGVSLSEFIRQMVEDGLARRALDAAVAPGRVRSAGGSATTTSTGGKVFRGMDPKGGKRK